VEGTSTDSRNSSKKITGEQMSDIRTKLLGLTALATVFAGLSYGQTVTCTAGTPNNFTLRQEGETELVSDATAMCTNNSLTQATVYASVSGTITSQKETSAQGGGVFGGNSDVVLQVQVGGSATVVYPGTVTGTLITFTGVNLPPSAFNLEVSNVRVNAAAAGSPQITESLLVQYNVAGSSTPLVVSTGGENVGYILPSLSVALAQTGTGQNIFFGNGVNGSTGSFTTCAGSSIGSSVPPAAFTLNVKEVVANAFKTLAQEGGSYVASATPNLAATTGGATQATELSVAFTGIPTAATLYLPLSVSSGGTTLVLQGSALTPVTSPSGLTGLNLFAFTPTSTGTVTATYVTLNNTSTGTLFSFPVYLSVAGGAAPVQTTAMTAAVTYIPTGAPTGPTAVIPTFAVSSATPINTLTVTPCLTTLLFPFVTNVAGFETGIAIANTTTDNLKSGGGDSVTAASGTCTLNFYGNTATQPTAFTTGSIGVMSTTNTVGPVFANTLTAMGPLGFTGYAIASCNFLDAHGFTYIISQFGTSSATAEGVLAVVLPTGRNSAGDGTNTGN